MLSTSLIGVLFLLIAYLIFQGIPELSPSSILSNHAGMKEWASSGRFFNYNQHAVFFRDSLGDVLVSGRQASLHSSDEKELLAQNLVRISQLPLLILLHGFPTFSIDWAPMYESLQKDHHVVCPDMMGYGVSDKPRDFPYTYHDQAILIEAIINRTIEERSRYSPLPLSSAENAASNTDIHVFAHDLGDNVAIELLTRQFERLESTGMTSSNNIVYKSLILLNGGLFPETHLATTVQKLFLDSRYGPLLQVLNTYGFYKKSVSVVFGEDTKPSEHELGLFYDAQRYKSGVLLLHDQLQYIQERIVHRERTVNGLLRIATSMPTLLINGPGDPVSGRHMVERYNELIVREGGKTNVTLLGERIGHYPHLEDTKSVQAVALDFLASLSRR